mgnify:CR=1 FL=1
MGEGIFRKGEYVRTVTVPICSLGSNRPIKVGTVGQIIGVRHGTNERLILFGKNRPVHCTTDELEEVSK